jgi:hypothetical protein
MKTIRKFLVLPLAFVTIAVGTASAAQQHVVTPSQVSAAVAERTVAQDADRASIREALSRPDVKNVAATMGVDVDQLNSAVGTMNASELAEAAATARQVNDQLVGGASNVVISTTTIIIALLVVILIVLVAD